MSTTTAPIVGVMNAGSSSLKFSVYDADKRILAGQIEGLGVHPAVSTTGADGQPLAPPELGATPPTTPSETLPAIRSWIAAQLGDRRLAAIGHRVVHGGPHHTRPALVTAELLAELEALVPLAPLHEPHNIAPIKMAMQLDRGMPQVACFDTAFHRTMPDIEQAYALPHAFFDEGVRRFGFHGLSYEYIACALPERAPDIAQGRVIVLHLGSGCSACAMQAGKSVTTTMGFTALDGLVMGTRSGALDPGIILHLIQQRRMTVDAVTDLLYRRSGVLGLSGISADFRELLQSSDPRAEFAVELFCHSAARHIGSLAGALGGLDGIVFTAGVGENAAPVRSTICRKWAWLGVELDEEANAANAERISAPGSPVAVFVLKTDENLMIARHTRALIAA